MNVVLTFSANRFSSRLWIGMIIADMIFSCAQLYEPKEVFLFFDVYRIIGNVRLVRY